MRPEHALKGQQVEEAVRGEGRARGYGTKIS